MVVPRPRGCDAVGDALRDAYGRDAALPDAMLDCLAAIDRKMEARSRN